MSVNVDLEMKVQARSAAEPRAIGLDFQHQRFVNQGRGDRSGEDQRPLPRDELAWQQTALRGPADGDPTRRLLGKDEKYASVSPQPGREIEADLHRRRTFDCVVAAARRRELTPAQIGGGFERDRRAVVNAKRRCCCRCEQRQPRQHGGREQDMRFHGAVNVYVTVPVNVPAARIVVFR